MIRVSDTRDIKGGIQKLSMTKKLVKNVAKVVHIVNLPHLLVQNCIYFYKQKEAPQDNCLEDLLQYFV